MSLDQVSLDPVRLDSEPLYSPRVVRALLERYGLRADKAFGQNFLIDSNSLDSIVEAAELDSNDTVLEIGPGLGVLTRRLALNAKQVISVELDTRLIPLLQETVKQDNVTLVEGDGLTYEFAQLPQGSLLVANLPYNVGTPILVRALESGRFKRLVVMLQKEVAQRLEAAPSTPSYGALSLVVKAYGDAHRVRDVKPSSFMPAPEVSSSVVRIDTHGRTPPEGLLTFIHTAFKHRRKTLKKNLTMAGLAKSNIEMALASLQLDPKLRAEALPLETFEALYKELEPS